jgi:hypothetical protein
VRSFAALFIVAWAIRPTYAQDAKLLVHPEAISGRWEAPDGRGGEVGMNILLTTSVASTTTDLIGVPHNLQDFEIGIYQRWVRT